MPSKTNHETLGIRPNAGRDEIEMAYRGRRSQYHPDRYAQADAETQAWATTCMQEINVAYAALTDPNAPPIPPAPSNDAQTRSSAQNQVHQTLGAALRAHVISRQGLDRIYIAPNIPSKKLQNALESYGHGLKPSDVLVLLDDTIFSSGKDGLLVTERELRVKEAFNPSETFGLDGIVLGIRKGKLYVNNRRVRDFNITNRDDVKDFVLAFNEIINRSASSTEQVHAAQTPSAASTLNSNIRAQLFRHKTEQYLIAVHDRCKAKIDRVNEEANGLRTIGEMGMLLHTVKATGELAKYVKAARGDELSDSDRACLYSDAVRVELVLYQMAWITEALRTSLYRSPSEIEADMRRFVSMILIPVLVTVQDNAELEGEASPQLFLGTPLQAEVVTRMEWHNAFLSESDPDHGSHLLKCLENPVVMFARSVSMTPDIARGWEEVITSTCTPDDLQRLAYEMHQELGKDLFAYRGPDL